MNGTLASPWLFAGLLSLAPALALRASWPGRRWAAAETLLGSAAVWAAGWSAISTADERLAWLALGVWLLLGGLCAVLAAARQGREASRLESALGARRARVEELRRRVAAARSKGSQVEAEQREVLALYGLIKGLSEALSWEELRPKLEAAVQQFLGLEEFALYVSDLNAPDALHPLLTRRLGNSIGASWETLGRYLQERGLSLSGPHRMEAPDRAVLVPIREGAELMGCLFGRVPSGAEPAALVRKMCAFAEETAFAFRRIKLFQEVERLSQTDGLTGVARRGVLDQRLAEEAVRARTFKTSFCLMLLDIDHFKKLNDTYGHPFGDQVLRRVGEVLKASVYDTDFVARYGGEEFAILLPRAEAAGVLRKAEAVRANIENEVFQLGLETIRVTVSIGIAHFPRDASTPEELVHQADQALYHAKETGRNRAVDAAALRR